MANFDEPRPNHPLLCSKILEFLNFRTLHFTFWRYEKSLDLLFDISGINVLVFICTCLLFY